MEGSTMPEGGVKGILSKETAGFPNWVWLLIIGAGVAAAYIIPKFLNKNSTSSNSTDTSGSGLGLAVDPTTGLPYAVSGLVPSGGYAGGDNNGQIGSSGGSTGNSNGGNQGASGGSGTGTGSGSGTGPGGRFPIHPPIHPGGGSGSGSGSGSGGGSGSTGQAKYVTVQAWPSQDGSLSGIASHYGLSLQRIEQLNPQIKDFNLIYAGQQIRIA